MLMLLVLDEGRVVQVRLLERAHLVLVVDRDVLRVQVAVRAVPRVLRRCLECVVGRIFDE